MNPFVQFQRETAALFLGHVKSHSFHFYPLVSLRITLFTLTHYLPLSFFNTHSILILSFYSSLFSLIVCIPLFLCPCLSSLQSPPLLPLLPTLTHLAGCLLFKPLLYPHKYRRTHTQKWRVNSRDEKERDMVRQREKSNLALVKALQSVLLF